MGRAIQRSPTAHKTPHLNVMNYVEYLRSPTSSSGASRLGKSSHHGQHLADQRNTPNCTNRRCSVEWLFVCERGGMVDALSSGGSERMLVRVQVPPLALFTNG